MQKISYLDTKGNNILLIGEWRCRAATNLICLEIRLCYQHILKN